MLSLLEGHEYSTEFNELMKVRNIAKSLFKVCNPIKFTIYNGNCCRQMGFICKKFLEEMIPEYEWTVYESTFLHVPTRQEYEHCWCYGVCKNKTGILVDLAFDNEYNKNYIIETDINKIPCEDVEYKLFRKVLDDEYFERPEYYTGLLGSQLILAIKKINNKIMEG